MHPRGRQANDFGSGVNGVTFFDGHNRLHGNYISSVSTSGARAAAAIHYGGQVPFSQLFTTCKLHKSNTQRFTLILCCVPSKIISLPTRVKNSSHRRRANKNIRCELYGRRTLDESAFTIILNQEGNDSVYYIYTYIFI